MVVAVAKFPTSPGYMTERFRQQYLDKEIKEGRLPKDAHRIAHVISLQAPSDAAVPIRFWQLYSVLGNDKIESIVGEFYSRIFADEKEPWLRKAFADLGPQEQHVWAQAGMWSDTMGGGRQYHGGEYRLNFHHAHNGFKVLNQKGATRWAEHMIAALDASDKAGVLTQDPRVRRGVEEFLSFFMGKYAKDFDFDAKPLVFGSPNEASRRMVDLVGIDEEQLSSLSVSDLKEALAFRGVSIQGCVEKEDLRQKASDYRRAAGASATTQGVPASSEEESSEGNFEASGSDSGE
ncbi:hypothetical protein T484DRAFT_1938332 [Baffinella frigidus]|nr:hypothetical protein T484DRAFT_1938332 [Cryptophyta sp. CCMP2293]|mmetsp:Transcript_64589/g.154108  ORF Transcript_64589/g.154108 Transcript_64589/m.154108 type:complete len:291 (+) Transcript_64589:107-979(+)